MTDQTVALKEIRRALVHLNDLAALAANPLAQQLLPAGAGAELVSPGAHLRTLLIDLIESLKPSPDVPPLAPEWRRYRILHDRYILRRPLREIEQKLAVGDRQLRREHERSIAILAEMVHLQRMTGVMGEPAVTPRQAIARLVPVARVFRLEQQVAEVLALLAQAGKTENITIRWRVEPGDLSVCTDPGILRQLLARLLMALIVRVTGDGCPDKPSIFLGVLLDNNQAILTVTAERIRVELADEDLQLCRLLAQTLGTEINLFHEAPAHYSLTLTLPVDAHLRKVLVIDDELPVVELFESYLIGLNYQLFGETKAEDAIRRALELQPDAVVLDVMMPGMDGWGLAQRLRHTPRLSHIPIIICSVLEEPDLVAAVGAAGFLRKPVLRLQLITALEQAIRPADLRHH